MKYVTYDPVSGLLTGNIEVTEKQLVHYPHRIPVDTPVENTLAYKVVEGELVERPESEYVVEDTYDIKRKKEYPGWDSQLDAIFKGFKSLNTQVSLPQETKNWLQEIEAVKTKHPKDTQYAF